jgi:hypothetical protein
MKYMVLIAGEEPGQGEQDDPRRRAVYERILAWWGENTANGQILDGHELEPSSTATTVRVQPDGGTTVTDGPFAESKEVVGGYAIIDVPDLDAAIALVSGWPGQSALEIRPIVESG